MSSDWHRVLANPILKVFWAGWESDTVTLQRNGWQISVQEEFSRRAFRLALSYPPLKMYGLSKYIEERVLRTYADYYAHERTPELEICALSSNIMIIEQGDFSGFRPANAEPEWITMQQRHIDQYKIFRPLENIKEIVIEPQSVDELMEKILSMQSVKQKEIREKARKQAFKDGNCVDLSKYREVYNPKTDIIAQVVSVG